MPKQDPRITELYAQRARARQGGGRERIDRQHAKGKLTARERLDLLLDPGTFDELESYAASRGDALGLSDEKYPGDGVVAGFGQNSYLLGLEGLVQWLKRSPPAPPGRVEV